MHTFPPSVHISAWPRLTTLLRKVIRLLDKNRSVKRPIFSVVPSRTSRSITLNTSDRDDSRCGTIRICGGGSSGLSVDDEATLAAALLSLLAVELRKVSSVVVADVRSGRGTTGDDKAAVSIGGSLGQWSVGVSA